MAYRPVNSTSEMINKQYIVNCPIDRSLLLKAEQIFGRPYQKIKSRSRKRQTSRISLYDRLVDGCIALEVDIMTFYRHLFLVSCAIPHSHCRIQHLGPTKSEHMIQDVQSLMNAYENISSYYVCRGWKISYLVFDSECGMVADRFQNYVKRKGTMPVPLPSGDHTQRVERKQGYLKETCRVLKTGFPTSLPHRFVPSLVEHAVVQINTAPSQGNVENTPPQMPIDGIPHIDYNHWYPCAFGDMAAVHKKAQAPDKAEDFSFEAIALYPADNINGGYWFYNLETGRIVPRTSYQVLPSYTLNARRKLTQLYDEDIQKVAKLKRLRGDDTCLADLRFKPSKSTRVAIAAEEPVVEVMYDLSEESESEREEEPQDVAEIFYTTGEDTIDQKKSFSSVIEYMMYTAPEVEAEALIFAAQLSLKKGVKLYGAKAIEAIKQELEGIVQRSVFEGIHLHKLSRGQRKMLFSKMMITKKETVEGVLKKIKARLVVLGNLQDSEDIQEEVLNSPTPSINTVLMQITRAAVQNRKVVVFDIGQAFLNSYLSKKGDDIIMHLKKEIADVLLQVDESYKEFLRRDGSIVVKLNKALYGLRQAPRLWYDTLKAFLLKDGFVVSPMDDCHFKRVFDDGTSIDLSIHVDDGLCTTDNIEEMHKLLEKLKDVFKIVDVHEADEFEYLKMKFAMNRDDNTVEITQPAYYDKILEEWEVKGSVTTPHTDDLFKVKINELLDEQGQKRFHSTVFQCLYLAIRTRPDIMVAIGHLTTRVRKGTANKSDEEKLLRVLKYLKSTRELGIMLGGDENNELVMKSFADASYGLHDDAKSHTGLFMTLGRGPILWKSYKQKSVTKSSCEAEILALSDMVSLAIWMRDMFQHMYSSIAGKITIFEDNQAAIHLINNGMTTSDRSRHIHIRNNFVNQFVSSGDIEVVHCPTKLMIADILTKPLQPAQFLYLRDYLLGYKIPEKGCVK